MDMKNELLKITVEEDCGNAPKRVVLRDFTIAYAQGDMAHLLEQVADNVRWQRIGDQVLEGKAAVAEALPHLLPDNATELTITNVMTHGNIGAVDGVLVLADGRHYAFCEVYRFSSHAKSAKIKEISSYVIQS